MKKKSLLKIDELCRTKPEFQNSMPENQPDYPGTGHENLNFAEQAMLSSSD